MYGVSAQVVRNEDYDRWDYLTAEGEEPPVYLVRVMIGMAVIGDFPVDSGGRWDSDEKTIAETLAPLFAGLAYKPREG